MDLLRRSYSCWGYLSTRTLFMILLVDLWKDTKCECWWSIDVNGAVTVTWVDLYMIELGNDRLWPHIEFNQSECSYYTTYPRASSMLTTTYREHTTYGKTSKGDERPYLPAEFLLPLPIHPELPLGNILQILYRLWRISRTSAGRQLGVDVGELTIYCKTCSWRSV